MPARAIWSGSISFGLVNVPVKVVTAVRHKEVKHRISDRGFVRASRSMSQIGG